MSPARVRPATSINATNETPGEVLVDLGAALVVFGTALQKIGSRMQESPSKPSGFPLAPATAPATPISGGLPAEGFVRIWNIIGRKAHKGSPAIPGTIPVSSGTWYAGVKSGRFPKPIKHGGIAMWRVEDIRVLLAQLYADRGSFGV